MENQELFRKIADVIEVDIKPFIESDGGKIELVRVDENNVVFVKLAGACAGCMGAVYTIKGGVERILREKVSPDIEVRLDI